MIFLQSVRNADAVVCFKCRLPDDIINWLIARLGRHRI